MASVLATTSPDSTVTTDARLSPISARFAALKAEGRRALVCYVTAGHPDPAKSVELLRGLEAAGADVIEVGVPFSDPLADGPVIQRSSQIAIERAFEGHAVLNRNLRTALNNRTISERIGEWHADFDDIGTGRFESAQQLHTCCRIGVPRGDIADERATPFGLECREACRNRRQRRVGCHGRIRRSSRQCGCHIGLGSRCE